LLSTLPLDHQGRLGNNNSNNIWQCSPIFCHLLPHRYIFSEHPVLIYSSPSGLVVRVPDYRSWEVVSLGRGTLNLVSTIEELLGRKSSGSCLENGEYGLGDSSCWPCGILSPKKLALTSPTSGGRSVGTQATEFVCFCKRPQHDIQSFAHFNLYF
jgi:hypothetical protein